jgi:hypothetical protein
MMNEMKRNHEPTRKKRNFKKCLCNHIDEVLAYWRKLTNRPFFLSFMDLWNHQSWPQCKKAVARRMVSSWKGQHGTPLVLESTRINGVVVEQEPCLFFETSHVQRPTQSLLLLAFCHCLGYPKLCTFPVKAWCGLWCRNELSVVSFHHCEPHQRCCLHASYQGSSSIPNRSHYQEHQ